MARKVIDTAEAPVNGPVFNANDRCDRCGAQASLRAVLPLGELLFCGHHGRLHREQLDAQSLYVQDGQPLATAQ